MTQRRSLSGLSKSCRALVEFGGFPLVAVPLSYLALMSLKFFQRFWAQEILLPLRPLVPLPLTFQKPRLILVCHRVHQLLGFTFTKDDSHHQCAVWAQPLHFAPQQEVLPRHHRLETKEILLLRSLRHLDHFQGFQELE